MPGPADADKEGKYGSIVCRIGNEGTRGFLNVYLLLLDTSYSWSTKTLPRDQNSGVQKLTDIKGLSEAKIEKMVEAAKKLCPSQYGWQSAREVEHQVTLKLSSPLLMLLISNKIYQAIASVADHEGLQTGAGAKGDVSCLSLMKA